MAGGEITGEAARRGDAATGDAAVSDTTGESGVSEGGGGGESAGDDRDRGCRRWSMASSAAFCGKAPVEEFRRCVRCLGECSTGADSLLDSFASMRRSADGRLLSSSRRRCSARALWAHLFLSTPVLIYLIQKDLVPHQTRYEHLLLILFQVLPLLSLHQVVSVE